MNKLIRFLRWWWKESKLVLGNEDGAIWLALAAIATVFGVGISAYSTYQQGQAQAQQADFNAMIASRNAELAARKVGLTKQQTELQAEKFRKHTESIKSAQRVQYAKAGVTGEGTPLITAADTQLNADIDELAIRYAGSLELSDVLAQEAEQRQKEALFKMKGKEASMAGTYGAGASLLSGFGTAAGYMAM